MKEILLTSSVLILALLILREVFREKISRRVQYALWGLVLLRLLVPVNLPAVDFSVLSAVEPARAQVEQRLEENPVYVLPVERREISLSSDSEKTSEPTVILPVEGRYSSITHEKGQPPVMTSYAFTLEEALGLAWFAGMAGMGLWLAVSNLRFWMMLRKKRIPLELPECRHPVFLVEDGLVSPCLFGLVKPAVYLTPGALESEDGLRHVLAHEETHGRHGDPVWAALRSICLVVYWFNPLVWWAAAASKEDCELACDEGALIRLGADERIPYGQTLLRLIPLQKVRGGALLTATTMTSDKKRMKERIMRIAENRKMKTAALCALLALVVCLCAVTFTGCTAGAEGEPDTTSTSAKPDTPKIPASDMPSAVVGPTEDAIDRLTIPLTDLAPYEPARVETLSAAALFETGHHDDHGGHHSQEQTHIGGGCRTTEGCSTFAWGYGGNIYVSSHKNVLSSFPSDYFLCIEDKNYYEEAFSGVLGHDGVMISYLGYDADGYWTTFNDYYVFEDDGVYLLARVCGVPYLLDMNGDGVNELVGTDGYMNAQIFFQRDGKLYEADIPELFDKYWGRWGEGEKEHPLYMAYTESFDPLASEYFFGWSELHPQYMEVEAYIPVPADDGSIAALRGQRQLYFDGVNLYLYRPERQMTDHMLDNIQELNVITDAAKAKAKAIYENWVEHYGEKWADPDTPLPEWDDYCVTGLECAYLSEPGELPGGVTLIAYRVTCEVHSPTPERVVWAGGTYVGEDGWVGGFWTDASPYIVFQMLEDGTHKLLENRIAPDMNPGWQGFGGEIATTLMLNQLILPSEASGEALLMGALSSPDAFADALALYPDFEQDVALMKLLEYVDELESKGEYGRQYVTELIEIMSNYSGDGENVFKRLEDLMAAPVVVHSF